MHKEVYDVSQDTATGSVGKRQGGRIVAVGKYPAHLESIAMTKVL